MRKFHFSLDPLMRVRELAVRDSEIHLARAQQEQRRIEEARRVKEEELRRAVKAAPAGTVVTVRELLEMDAERRRLRGLLHHAEQNLARSDQEIEEKRLRLLDARRDEKVVGKLREKRFLEYARDVLRQEQRNTDEAASRRHGRKAA